MKEKIEEVESKKVKVVFIGNYREYEYGKEYEIDEGEAVKYLAIGYIKLV